MSLCDSCLDPGHCCRKFSLNRNFVPGTDTEETMQAWLDNNPQLHVDGESRILPFKWSGTFRDFGGSVGIRATFGCTKLTPEGRCSIYDHRPKLCEQYQPLTDEICYHFDPTTAPEPIVALAEDDTKCE